jgi:hypothetical protein
VRYYKGPTSDLVPMSAAQLAEFEARAQEKARAAQLRREKIARGPTARIRGLGVIGDSALLPTVKDSARASTLVRKVALDTGGTYSCRTERCPIDGHIEGIRVTRTA